MVETGAASASGSILAYFVLKLWNKTRDKQKINGLLLVKGKSYLEEKLINNKVIFFDIDKFLSDDKPLYQHPNHIVKLNLFPKATRKLKILKNEFKDKTIVICSSHHELLKHLNIKDKNIHIIIPSSKMMSNEISLLANNDVNNYKSLELLRNSLSYNKNAKTINNWEEQILLVRNIFNIPIDLY